jgi:hypothetical protein
MRILFATTLAAATTLVMAECARAGEAGAASIDQHDLRAVRSQANPRRGPVPFRSYQSDLDAPSGRQDRWFRTAQQACRLPAVDFIPPRGKYGAVAAWLKQNHRGGVGTYGCGMNHIHIDDGGQVRWHKCGGSKSAKRGKSGRKSVSRSARRA